MRTFLFAFMVLTSCAITFAANQSSAPADKSAPAASASPAESQPSMEWDRSRERGELRERQEEYTKWLGKNYPEEAAQLAALKKQNPDKYFQRLTESYEKYGRLARADKRNPEMAKLIRQDMELKSQEEKLVADIRAASDEKQKTALTEKLRQLESKRFDNIIAQKQLRFQELNKRLDDLNKEIKDKEAELGKLKSNKDEEVKKHINDLLTHTEKMNWD